jgi:hypothetical protein
MQDLMTLQLLKIKMFEKSFKINFQHNNIMENYVRKIKCDACNKS